MASRSVWAEIRKPKHLSLGGLFILVCGGLIVALAAWGQTAFGWVTGVIAVVVGLLSPAVLVWRRMDTFVEQAHSKLQRQKDVSEARIEHLAGQLDRVDPARRLKNLLSEISTPERYEPADGRPGDRASPQPPASGAGH